MHLSLTTEELKQLYLLEQLKQVADGQTGSQNNIIVVINQNNNQLSGLANLGTLSNASHVMGGNDGRSNVNKIGNDMMSSSATIGTMSNTSNMGSATSIPSMTMTSMNGMSRMPTVSTVTPTALQLMLYQLGVPSDTTKSSVNCIESKNVGLNGSTLKPNNGSGSHMNVLPISSTQEVSQVENGNEMNGMNENETREKNDNMNLNEIECVGDGKGVSIKDEMNKMADNKVEYTLAMKQMMDEYNFNNCDEMFNDAMSDVSGCDLTNGVFASHAAHAVTVTAPPTIAQGMTSNFSGISITSGVSGTSITSALSGGSAMSALSSVLSNGLTTSDALIRNNPVSARVPTLAPRPMHMDEEYGQTSNKTNIDDLDELSHILLSLKRNYKGKQKDNNLQNSNCNINVTKQKVIDLKQYQYNCRHNSDKYPDKQHAGHHNQNNNNSNNSNNSNSNNKSHNNRNNSNDSDINRYDNLKETENEIDIDIDSDSDSVVCNEMNAMCGIVRLRKARLAKIKRQTKLNLQLISTVAPKYENETKNVRRKSNENELKPDKNETARASQNNSIVFECQFCNLKYLFLQQLRMHQRMAHQNNVKPFECRACQKRFFKNESLMHHYQTNHF